MMYFKPIARPFDGESFGPNCPSNYEEIIEFLNDYFEENGYNTKEEAENVWEMYCCDKIPNAPTAKFE